LIKRDLWSYALAEKLWASPGGVVLMRYHDICTMVMDSIVLPPVDERSQCLLELSYDNFDWFERMVDGQECFTHRGSTEETCLHKVIRSLDSGSSHSIPLASLMTWTKSIRYLVSKMTTEQIAARDGNGCTAYANLKEREARFDFYMNYGLLLSHIETAMKRTNE